MRGASTKKKKGDGGRESEREGEREREREREVVFARREQRWNTAGECWELEKLRRATMRHHHGTDQLPWSCGMFVVRVLLCACVLVGGVVACKHKQRHRATTAVAYQHTARCCLCRAPTLLELGMHRHATQPFATETSTQPPTFRTAKEKSQ